MRKPLPPPPSEPRGPALPLLLLALTWLATPVLLLIAASLTWPWLGETPTAADLARSRSLRDAALATGVVAPAIGSVLALAWHRRVAAGVLGAAVLVTLAATAWLDLF